MADPLTPVDTSTAAANACPWCSAAITPQTAVCPSCNAILIPDEEHDLPGLTSVVEAPAREKRPASRGRFMSWLGGESVEQAVAPVDAQAIAPPDADVQREILRLELEAHISNLQAEADSIMSDALVEGRVNDLPEGLRPLVAAEASAESPADTADAMVEAVMGTDAPAAEDAQTGTDPVDADATSA
jgi:hypothetical protein